MTHTVESSLDIGWWPPSMSMIDSLRMPRVTPSRWMLPSSSGPRWTIDPHIRWTSSPPRAGSPPAPPAVPHVRWQQLLADNDRREDQRHGPQRKSGKPEEVHRLRRIAAEQLDRDQVEHDPRRARQRVFRLAVRARPVIDRQLGDACADHRRVD